MLSSILPLVVELTDEWADHAIKWLLAGIVEVKVEVEEDSRVGDISVEILNNGGAENCLTAPGDAIKP